MQQIVFNHIKQNVKARFGPQVAEMVFPIAHAFLIIQEPMLLEQPKMKSASVYEYVEKSQWSTGAICNGLQHGNTHQSTDYHCSMVW